MNDDLVLDGEEMWSSKAIDEANQVLKIVKGFLEKVIKNYSKKL